MKKKVLSLLLVLAMGCMMVAGCSKNNGGSGKKGGDDNWKTYQEKTGKDGDVTITWWLMGGQDAYYQKYWTEMKGLQKIQEITGVNIDFKVANSYEVYLPMMTAKNFPHVITAKNLEQYRGRLAAMYKDEVSIRLNEMMDEYMPNFSKIVKDYPSIGRDLRLDDGTYSYVSALYDTENDDDRAAASQYGLAIRKDWLDEVGKEIPTTIDEWYDVLMAFKQYDPNGNKEADEEPVCMASSGWKYFLTAYGIDDDPIIQKDGKVIYGFMTEAYKQYLEEMAKWHKEGLIYNMFENTSLESRQDRVTGNIAGAWKADAEHFEESDPNSYISILRTKAPYAEFAAVPWPKTADGYQWCYSDIASFDRDTTVITKNAEKDGVEKAAAYIIDYMLSEKGSTYLTWGIEGESFEEVNGEKKLMKGMNDKVKFYETEIQKLNTYADATEIMLPQFGQISSFILANKSEGYSDACKTWSVGDKSYKLSPACQLSVDQQTKVEEVTAGMKSYVGKMRQRFIEGKVPMTDYDTYVDQVQRMGGDEYAAIWQAAYDAYQSR